MTHENIGDTILVDVGRHRHVVTEEPLSRRRSSRPYTLRVEPSITVTLPPPSCPGAHDEITNPVTRAVVARVEGEPERPLIVSALDPLHGCQVLAVDDAHTAMTACGTGRTEGESGLTISNAPPIHVGAEVRGGIEPLPFEEQLSVTTREQLDAPLPALAGVRRADQHLLAAVAVEIRNRCQERRARHPPHASSEPDRLLGHGHLRLLFIQPLDSRSQEKDRCEVK